MSASGARSTSHAVGIGRELNSSDLERQARLAATTGSNKGYEPVRFERDRDLLHVALSTKEAAQRRGQIVRFPDYLRGSADRSNRLAELPRFE
ncbi:MAG: hypothetical protein LC797_10545 [Chloroflexi bacterium]|nr:hypothetical protein [Chloroflexota bacterium]